MFVKLEARIKKTTEAIAAEKDPAKLRALNSTLAILTAAKAEMDDDDDDGGDGGDGDDSKSKKAAEAARKAKGAAEAAKHRAKAAEHKAKAAEAEEEAKRCEEEAEGGEEDDGDSEEAKAAKAAARIAEIGAGAVDPTVVALAAQVRTLTKRAAEGKAAVEATERKDLLARAAKYMPKHLLKPIAETANLATLRAMVVEAEKGSPMVATSEGDLIRPKSQGPEDGLPKETLAMIEAAVSGFPGNKAEFRKTLVKSHVDALNGAGRY
jgi:hypothetical protein